jgi:uncharacterized protein
MVDADSHVLLLYDYVENMPERRGPYREAHLARILAEREAGRIVMAGALGDPPIGGALVFRGVDAEEMEAFVSDDPYMQAGLITSWRARPWKLI